MTDPYMSMENVSQIGARVAEIDDDYEIIQSKVLRNGLTPIGRLPSELLIQITREFMTLPDGDADAILYNLLVITAVFSRLRSEIVGTPGFWSGIEFSHWKRAKVEVLLARSTPHPLKVAFGPGSMKHDNIDLALAHMYKVEIINLQVAYNEQLADAFISALRTLTMPSLKEIQLRGPLIKQFITADFLGPSPCVNLRSICFRSVRIERVPGLPRPRALSLSFTYCSYWAVDQLHHTNTKFESYQSGPCHHGFS
jgi:hypothetical protein